jgi:hypothetical protein
MDTAVNNNLDRENAYSRETIDSGGDNRMRQDGANKGHRAEKGNNNSKKVPKQLKNANALNGKPNK